MRLDSDWESNIMHVNSSYKGKRLVIDTCICQAAGNFYSNDKISRICSDVLDCVSDLKYYIVYTPEIEKEINKHLAEYPTKCTISWITKMRSKNLIYIVKKSTKNNELRKKIKLKQLSQKQLSEALKDIILIEAANITDNKVLSRDKRAYKLYKGMAKDINEIKIIVWYDLNNPDHNIKKWLRSGAKYLKKDTLGYNS